MKQLIVLVVLLLILIFFRSQDGGKRGTIVVQKKKLSRIEEFDLGEKTFKSPECYSCTYCHTPYKYDMEQRKGIILLKGVYEKRGMQWLYFFLRSPQMLAEAKDTAVLRINNDFATKYKETNVFTFVTRQHPACEKLSYGTIKAIFFYVDSMNRRKDQFNPRKKQH